MCHAKIRIPLQLAYEGGIQKVNNLNIKIPKGVIQGSHIRLKRTRSPWDRRRIARRFIY